MARLSPTRVLPLMALSVFTAEALVMLLLSWLPEMPLPVEAVTDAGVLLILLSPTFYYFHYRPLKAQLAARKEVVDQLLESEERFNLAMTAVNDGLWDWDIETGRLFFSPRGQKVLGYTRDELEPHFQNWEKLVHPQDLEPALRSLRDLLSGRQENWEVEHRLRNKNGQWVWVLARGRVIERNTRGEPRRAIGTYTDISVRKQAGEQLRQSKEDIRQLSRQLMATSESEKKLVAQDLHDEFGQVLTAFQMGVEMLREHSFKNEDDFKSQCDRLLGLSSRMQKNIRSICDGLRPLMLDVIGLAATLEWLVQEFAQQSPNIEFVFRAAREVKCPAPDCEVVLYRICQEALNNCVKHSQASRVEVSLSRESAGLKLSVRDNGGGVPLERIRKDRKGYWGLGLLGIHERAAAISAEVLIDSTPGRGMTIEILVPEQTEEGRE